VKIHLGCGKRNLKGYVHIDLADYPHINYKHNINSLPMLEDNSVDLIYASHVLEYFDRYEVLNVLKEWKRVLMPGKILRLAVPDFESLLEVYKQTRSLSKIIGPIFGRWEIPGSDMIIYHKTVYDFIDLKSVLIESGFSEVKRWDWKTVFTGENENFDDYSQAYFPHMDKEKGKLISLNVEAIKNER
jgi:predicted SAM-dependent methyltransferase